MYIFCAQQEALVLPLTNGLTYQIKMSLLLGQIHVTKQFAKIEQLSWLCLDSSDCIALARTPLLAFDPHQVRATMR